MEHHIAIARPAEEVFDFLADPRHIPLWLPHLRRDIADLPAGGVKSDRGGWLVWWRFDPEGEWRIEAAEGTTRLTLALQPAPPPPRDPTDIETPPERLAHAAQAALHSVKSHVEAVGGGDPTLSMPDAPRQVYGHAAPRDPDA